MREPDEALLTRMESTFDDNKPKARKTIDHYLEKDIERATKRLIADVRRQMGDVAAANLESILFDPTLDPETRMPAKKQNRWIGLTATEVTCIYDLAKQHGVPLPKIDM